MTFVYLVADYDKWRAGFDANESSRRSAGSTGVNQFYRDVENPNNVTLILEWDEADNYIRPPHGGARFLCIGMTDDFIAPSVDWNCVTLNK